MDECNQYRYYSRFNLWQLDIITTCRKLSIPLEKVKQILELHDNAKITQLLLDYRSEALRLSRYYQQVARDISWYEQENLRISAGTLSDRVEKKWLEEEKFITGARKKDPDYHANLQKAAKDELRYAETIQRKYGYFLDLEQMKNGIFFKDREYLKIADCSYTMSNLKACTPFPPGNTRSASYISGTAPRISARCFTGLKKTAGKQTRSMRKSWGSSCLITLMISTVKSKHT